MRGNAAWFVACIACGGYAIDTGGTNAATTDVTNGTDGKGGFGDSHARGVADGAPFRVVFSSPSGGLRVYRSATGAVDALTDAVTDDFRCTYDGAAIATDRGESVVVLDRNGATIRTQTGVARAIRPDGLRAIVDRPVTQYPFFTEGTLDANGAYAVLAAAQQNLSARDYAPDGTTVLWLRRAFDHDAELVAAPVDLSSRRTLASVVTGTDLRDPAVSFDGSRVVYLDCATTCDLDVVNVPAHANDTLLTAAQISSPRFVPDGSAIVFYDGASDAIESLDVGTLDVTKLVAPVLEGTIAFEHLCVTSD